MIEFHVCDVCHRIVDIRIQLTQVGHVRFPVLHTDRGGRKCPGVRGEVITAWRPR